MKIVIAGGSGLIGRKLAAILEGRGHDVVAASPSTGVDTLTGAGLAEALSGADAVVDVTNSPSFADEAVMSFFSVSTRNLLAAAKAAGVAHHVALSVVGADRLPESGYFRAKLAQERMIAEAGTGYSIVRATQFFEFLGAVAGSSAAEDGLHLSTGGMQPMAADDVALALADGAEQGPVNGIVEIGGPDRGTLAGFVGRWMHAVGDRRAVIESAEAPYFGTRLDAGSLVPGAGARLMPTRLDDWLADQAPTGVA